MIFRLTCLVILSCIATGGVQAAETQSVTVGQEITGADVTPPSVPADVDGNGLSLFSLEVNWTASTDNVGVTGYRIWRDGVQIATTTLTSYIDTGLATNTTYFYQIAAFDAVGNESASSSPVGIATLAPAPPENNDNTPQSTLVTRGVEIQNVVFEANIDTIELSYETNRYVRTEVEWSSDTDSGGVSRGILPKKQHAVQITDVLPDSVYQVTIRTFVDGATLAAERTFQVYTKPIPDITPPPNVQNLSAEVTSDGRVLLSWINPVAADFDRVRIVRSNRFFPLDIVDGWVVYEGAGSQTEDIIGLEILFYTVFTFDSRGNVSSGATVVVYPYDNTEIDEGSMIDDTASSSSPYIPPDFTVEPTSDWVVYLRQQERVQTLQSESAISLAGHTPFTIAVPVESTPATLKTIIATLYHPDDPRQVFRFILKRNDDTNQYEATVGALPVKGVYRLEVQWFDYSSQTTGLVDGELLVMSASEVVAAKNYTPYYLAVLVFVILFLLRIISRHVRRSSV